MNKSTALKLTGELCPNRWQDKEELTKRDFLAGIAQLWLYQGLGNKVYSELFNWARKNMEDE